MDKRKKAKVEARLERQQGVVARWQLLADRLSAGEVNWVVGGWRTIHRGVYVTGHAPLTAWQRWYAATLTEPGTVLARWSCAAHLGLCDAAATDPAHVVRHGSGGQRRYRRTEGRLDELWLKYSSTLDGDLTTHDDIDCTTAARCLLDLCPVMGERQRDRLFRDAVRTKVVTREELRAVVRNHRGDRGTGRLSELLARYAEIPIEATRSDPEIEGLVVLREAGAAAPLVNVAIAGHEADFVDVDRRKILELDGPQFHQFPEIDSAKQAAWQAAGWTVERVHTDLPYEDPGEFLRAATG